MFEHLDFTNEFNLACDLLENTSKHLFITGRAGTGKSTLLQYFRTSTKKKVVVLAPTGVAAVNVKGQTIHSFFNFRPDITKDAVAAVKMRRGRRDLYRSLSTIIIDEISMVRADLLDCVDQFLRMHGPKAGQPFGGVQMVFIGDLYQLPPVVTHREKELFQELYASPYFFDAQAFADLDFEFIELQKIYRQNDNQFIDLLNAIRTNHVSGEHMALLNSRRHDEMDVQSDELYVYLTTTNAMADEVNARKLKDLGKYPYHFSGVVTGQFDAKSFPTHEDLELQIGAQVMMLNNDSLGRWINGSIGRITAIVQDEEEDDIIDVELSDGQRVGVTPYTWEMYRFTLDEETGMVESEVVGTFRQYPLRLAWAVTIHKSQGKTFDHVVVDIGRGTFSHGQVYVALSRCTSLEGLILAKPIHKHHILMDQRVARFMNTFQDQIPTLK